MNFEKMHKKLEEISGQKSVTPLSAPCMFCRHALWEVQKQSYGEPNHMNRDIAFCVTERREEDWPERFWLQGFCGFKGGWIAWMPLACGKFETDDGHNPVAGAFLD